MTTNGLDSKPKEQNKVTVVLGAQWGDEGKVSGGHTVYGFPIDRLICFFFFSAKGKIVDLIALHADIVCRCQVSV